MGRALLFALAVVAACRDSSGGSGDESNDSSGARGPSSSSGDVEVTSSGAVASSSSGEDESPATSGDVPDPPLPCPDEWRCKEDMDGDEFPLSCDNAPSVRNAEQGDMDYDSIGDVVDLCPTVQSLSESGDSDKDGVGNQCDTCSRPAAAYRVAPLPLRYEVRATPAQHDSDGHFVGDACEAAIGCVDRADARPLAFYDVAVGGYCCTTYYQGESLVDPDGEPLSIPELPASTPGLLVLPPGCDDALAVAGVAQATRLGPDDVGGLTALWDHLCLLPSWDQDLDGVPDACDLCTFAFDPDNTPYTDANGKLWPNDGAYCNGDYGCE